MFQSVWSGKSKFTCANEEPEASRFEFLVCARELADETARFVGRAKAEAEIRKSVSIVHAEFPVA